MAIRFNASSVDEKPKRDYSDPYKNYSKINLKDLSIGSVYSGTPSVHIYENEGETNKGKEITWDTLRIRIADDNLREVLVTYSNVPKADSDGYIRNIYANNSFYRNCFNVLFSVLGMENKDNLFDEAGSPINKIDEINLDDVIDFLNSKDILHLTVKKGATSQYPSFILE